MTPEHPAPSEWRERVAGVLQRHWLHSATGGTATGSQWACSCGATGFVRGARDEAQRQGFAHVASALLPLLAEAQADGAARGDGSCRRDPDRRCQTSLVKPTNVYATGDWLRARANRVGGEQR